MTTQRRRHIRLEVLTGTVSLLTATTWACAHHSFAMFDFSKEVTLSGTVKELQWNNPHCFIELLAQKEGGATEEWSIEMGSPLHLVRNGWKRTSVKPGDKITVVVHPLRDGTRGASYLSAIGRDGKPLGGQHAQ